MALPDEEISNPIAKVGLVDTFALGVTDDKQTCVGYTGAVGTMLLDEVADLGAQADTMVTTVEDHSQQLGELSVMMQMVQEMMGAQQERLMAMEAQLLKWSQHLVVWETTVNEHLIWLRHRVEAMDVDEEVEGETSEEKDKAMTSTEVDEGSPVVLDLDLDNFRSPEVRPTLVRRGSMGGQVNQLVRIEEEPLDEVEELVLNRVPPLYDDRVVHRLVPIEDSPPYEDLPRYLSVEL